MATEMVWATGRRKTAVARVRMSDGDGHIEVNGKPFEEFFPRDTLRLRILHPLTVVEKQKAVAIYSTVQGGGCSAQAAALAHGISRALLKLNAEFRPALKKQGLLTRDSRMKERKKYGQKAARKRFQYSKR